MAMTSECLLCHFSMCQAEIMRGLLGQDFTASMLLVFGSDERGSSGGLS